MRSRSGEDGSRDFFSSLFDFLKAFGDFGAKGSLGFRL